MNKLSATIITANEEDQLEDCLKSLDFVDEVVVIDDFSSDKTCEIARKYGAKVIQNSFEGFGQQKNLAAKNASYSWIFSIDADERVDEELKQSILETLKSPTHYLYEINRKSYFCGQFIRYGGWYPDTIPRLYNREYAKFSEPKVHELLIAKKGTVGRLSGHLDHYSFNSVSDQFRKNTKYAILGGQALEKKPSLVKCLIKPIGKFIECYFLKLGILDGRNGLIIAINAAYSIFMKYLVAKEKSASK